MARKSGLDLASALRAGPRACVGLHTEEPNAGIGRRGHPWVACFARDAFHCSSAQSKSGKNIRKHGKDGNTLRRLRSCFDETDPKLVPGIYKRLLDDEKVDLLIGGYGDNSVSPAMALVMERNRYLVALMALAVNASLNYPNYFAMIPTGPGGTSGPSLDDTASDFLAGLPSFSHTLRARANRDMTVPIGAPVVRAISR